MTGYSCWQHEGLTCSLGRVPSGLEARPAAALVLLGTPGFEDALLTRGLVTLTTAPGRSWFFYKKKIVLSYFQFLLLRTNIIVAALGRNGLPDDFLYFFV